MAAKTNYHCYQEYSHLRSEKPQVKIFIFFWFFSFLNSCFLIKKTVQRCKVTLYINLEDQRMRTVNATFFIFDTSLNV